MIIYPNNRIPLFSIVLCTYNRAKLISRAIESVLTQEESDWELIIIDDGSTDSTTAICLDYAVKSDKIRYIYQQNKGLPLARNSGILASSGLYVTFLDSDDEYHTNHLKTRKIILLRYPEVDFLYSKVDIVGSPFVPDKNDLSKQIHLDNCHIGGSFFIKREKLIELGGFRNIPYSEDSDLYERASEKEFCIASIDLRTYIYYRDTEDSLCNKASKFVE